MTSSPPFPSPNAYLIPPRYWAWLGTRWAVVVLVWLAAAVCGVMFTYRALHWFDAPEHLTPERRRADGNAGHAQIDFGGQWLMGRMVVTGHGRELYHRQRQWQVLRDSYPVSGEAPLQQEESQLPRPWRKVARPDEDLQHDYANMMNWFMGADATEDWNKVGRASALLFAQPPTGNPFVAVAYEKAAADAVTPELLEAVNKPAIGGPLYPPVHAIFYVPLGLIENPQRAYQVFQVFCALLVLLAALGVRVLTNGRIWWSVATLCLFLYPGTRGALDLGQNPTLSLCILVWGWALATRGYPVAGGMVWGLFAFKPVWALAFFLVPLLMRRWRFCLAMVLTGIAFGLLTFPFVGIQTWFDWLKIGREASALYEVNDNWIHLSRDLQGIPRRMFMDFSKPEGQRNTRLLDTLSWGLWGVVFATTVVLYLFCGDRKRLTGLSPGFLLLGAYLTCFHFMYYDVLLSAGAFAVLLAGPRALLCTKIFAVDPTPVQPAIPAERGLPTPAPARKPLGARMLGYVNSFPLTVAFAMFFLENSLSGMELEATVGIRYYATPASDGSTNATVPRVKGDTSIKYPIDTFLLMALWAWCGYRLVRGDERKVGHSLRE